MLIFLIKVFGDAAGDLEEFSVRKVIHNFIPALLTRYLIVLSSSTLSFYCYINPLNKEKADTAATSFKHHPSETPADHQYASEDLEKGYYGNESAETNVRIFKKGGVVGGTEESSGEDDDENHYISGVLLGLLTFGLCMATFTVALDNTIIATAIPKITSVFNSLGDVGWYGSSYLLTTTALQPSFGRIYTYFDVKWTYLSALVLFEIGSIICAAARNSVTLIVGRAVAGAGASLYFLAE
ncbi:fa99eeed-0d79-433d-9188-ef55d8ac1cba [Sclerotinia trifoliorum]|uniref:Fa99eeed-0d79-433d-9188-ef55d8ac1cba n=1 Tax=Sclerotinia trifoliorum TaxID=28548 RepID=A0A8H2VXB3_9HELO|nr:fa99eeed-0d79-433d-9188-ef55d8ac1cba [Sclerotinia trifoliorum]